MTRKLTQQYVGPFQISKRVGRLAYKLEIPDGWLVHPVFSIAQLEPCPSPGSDPFVRSTQHHIPPVSTNEDGSINYKIERLLNKRVFKKGKGYSTEYLVRRKSYGPEWDKWFNVKRLENAQDLVDECEDEMREVRYTTPFSGTTSTNPTPRTSPKRGQGHPPSRRKQARLHSVTHHRHAVFSDCNTTFHRLCRSEKSTCMVGCYAHPYLANFP